MLLADDKISARNPKFEIRGPKEIRNPKPETLLPRLGEKFPEGRDANASDFGIRTSDFEFSGYPSAPEHNPSSSAGKISSRTANL
jgi:hypothetical protein